jgi:hypothetical protein
MGTKFIASSHVHMIVPGGGFTKVNHWKNSTSNGDLLFPVKAMVKVYKGKFMEMLLGFLNENKQSISLALRKRLYDKHWVIYAKHPFKNAESVVEYLGRYSPKIAISNHRLKSIANGQISFTYKDYRHCSVNKIIALDSSKFLRRFCLHILPPKFMKIRHYGFLATRVKKKLKIEQMKQGVPFQSHNSQRLDFKSITKNQLGFDIEQCPCCKTG